jgi:hypothetical protein
MKSTANNNDQYALQTIIKKYTNVIERISDKKGIR